jgi:hypothetical protein
MSEPVRDAVFGNAGTIITFRVGGTDANFLVKEYEPVFDANDLVNLDKYNVYIKLLINGMSAPAFSAKTLPPVETLTDNIDKIYKNSRDNYSNPRALVEERINERGKKEEKELLAEAEAFKQGGLEALLAKKKKPEEESPAIERNNEVRSELFEKQEGKLSNEEKILPATVEQSNEEKSEKTLRKEEKPRVFKYQNIIGDKMYKEQTARGGVKWYVGEDIDRSKYESMGIEISKEAEEMIKLAKLVFNKHDKNTDENHSQKNNSDKNDPSKKIDEDTHVKPNIDTDRENKPPENLKSKVKTEPHEIKEKDHTRYDLKDGEEVKITD